MYKKTNNLFKFTDNINKRLCFLIVLFLMALAPLYGQKTIITGVVNDSDGLPVPGVSIVQKGTINGTAADEKGQYSIIVPNDNAVVLIFSFIGLKTQEIIIGDKRKINVNLSEESKHIDEVVVIGYGAQKKETIVGSISQATEKELKRTGNVSDFSNALAGQIPGLVTLTSSGEPGGGSGWGQSATQIFIRGKSTWNNATPLILVDGVERDLNNIDINEVASISVLKDASATAVFGVKGANGVILINSKHGQEGKMIVSASYIVTGTMLSKIPKTLDSYETMMAKNETIERETAFRPASWDAIVPSSIVNLYRWTPNMPEEYKELFPDVNWQDAMFKKMGYTHKANLNIQGGNKAMRYFSSFSYLHEGDMLKDYDNGKGYDPSFDYDRMNFRTNVDVALTSTTQLKVNLDGYYGNKKSMWSSGGNTGESSVPTYMWRTLYGMAPNVFPVQYSDGYWGTNIEFQNIPNPIAGMYNSGIQYQRTTSLNTNLKLEQDLKFITSGLTMTGMLSSNNVISSHGGIYDNYSTRPTDGNTLFESINHNWRLGPDVYSARYFRESTGDYAWTVQPWSIQNESSFATNGLWGRLPVDRQLVYQLQMSYARNLSDLGNFSAMGLFQREENAYGNEFKHYREDWVFRGTYDYNSRYMCEFNGAYNGSEQFGPGYRFAFFPSVGLGWNVSNEKFLSGVKWLDKLKLRYSIGKMGNDKVSSGRWLYESQYLYGGMARLGSSVNISNINTSPESPYDMYVMSIVGNPNLQWETSVKNNYGLEFSVLKNLITLTFDYFTEERKNILLNGTDRTLPNYFGFPAPYGNAGQTKSKGFEIDLGFDKKFREVHVWGRIYASHNRTKVIFKDDAPLMPDYQKNAGYTIDQQRSVINSGVFYQNWDQVYGSVAYDNYDNEKQPGYYDLIDFNGDGKIDSNDSAPIGYSEVPQNTANLSLGTDYKGWSFNIQFYGVNNASRMITLNNFRDNSDVLFDQVKDYWSKDNSNATSYLPRWMANRGNLGDFYLYDASYLKLRSVELAYTFNKGRFFYNKEISNLRIYLQGNDLFFWSKMPDARESGGSNGAYPLLKRINLGVEISF